MDYSELILESNRLIREIHRATTVRNFDTAEQYSENLVRVANSLQHALTTISLEEKE